MNRAWLCMAILCACSGGGPLDLGELAPGGAARPSQPQPQSAPSYSGGNSVVADAAERIPTGVELQRDVIYRTCSPINGVCHFAKEYPDLHTPANLISAIDASCNVQPRDHTAVYDRCERVGDRIVYRGTEREIGWVKRNVGEALNFSELERLPSAEDPGIVIQLRSAIAIDESTARRQGEQFRGARERAEWKRTFVNAGSVQELIYESFETTWWIIEDGTMLYAEVPERLAARAEQLLRAGIVQGDHNRNGVWGSDAEAAIPLIAPGNPEGSYLVGRLYGRLDGHSIPGSRMPLANQPFSTAEMLALFCWIEGLESREGARLESEIDYENCSFSSNPDALAVGGDGATWEDGIWPLLRANCGGCHGGSEPQANFDVMSDGFYDRLLELSDQNDDYAFVEPGDPTKSYLYLKLTGDPAIADTQGMPYDPVSGWRRLDDDAIRDIQIWIEAGAPAGSGGAGMDAGSGGMDAGSGGMDAGPG